MISDGTYEEYECALALDKHFLENPISLACGHNTCRRCIYEDIINKKLECKLCNQPINKNIAYNCVNLSLKKSLERNIWSLISVIEKQGLNAINGLKSIHTFNFNSYIFAL